MSKVFFKLANGNFLQTWTNTGLINTNNDWSAVDSIVGYKGEGVVSSTGKDPTTVTGEGTPDKNIPFVTANQTNGNFSTGGVTEFQLADPTIGIKGSGSANAPQLVLYMDATGRQDLHFSVDLRDLDNGATTNAIQPIAVQYRIGDSGAWINLPGGYVADATTGPGTLGPNIHLDLTLPAAANNQGQVEIRIITTDAVGTDEYVGLDNLAVTSSPMVVVADTTPPVVSSSSPSDGATMVPTGANLTLNFSEAVTLGTGTVIITDNNGDTRTIAVTDSSQVTLTGQTMTINPTADLKPGTTYEISLSAGAVKDLAGNAYSDSDANPVEITTTPPITRIFDIQGASHTSPLVGKTVYTQGVVTAVDTNGVKGFWIQDATGDGNDATSDAVFVAVPSGTISVKAGDLVQLNGTVAEVASGVTNNLTITELTSIQNLTVVSSGNVIAPTIIGTGGRIAPTSVIDSDHFGSFNPQTDAIDFYESLEGMLVKLKDAQVVGKTSASTSFVVTDSGANATGMNDRGAITRSEGDPNPERIEVFNDTGVTPGLTTSFNVGDKVGDLTGVVSYFNGFYEVLPTVTPGQPIKATIGRETTNLAGDATHLTVGAYDVANLSGTSAPTKVSQLAADIATNLHAPDMLGLEEVGDDNGAGAGVLVSDATIQGLIQAIVTAGGPQYAYVVVNPSTENSTGGDTNINIRNVILYNPDRVSYVNNSARLLSDNNLADGDAFVGSRKPLVADFLFRGEAVTFVDVHNSVRTGSDEPFGHNQPGVDVGDAARTSQTAVVQQFVAQQLQTNPDARIVVAGDFNGLHFETAQTQLEANGALTNLVRTLPVNDRYTSATEGNNEQLDHVLVSSKLAAGAEFDNVHINTNLATAGASDRDPVLARFFVNSAPVSNGDSPNAVAEDGVLSVDATQGVLANDNDVNHDALTAVLNTGPAHGTLALAADGSFTYQPYPNYHGSDSFSYIAKDAFGGQSSVATVQLTVTSVNDAPTLSASAPSAVLVEEGTDGGGNFGSEVSLQIADVDSATSYDTSDWTFESEGTYSRVGTYGTAILDTIHNKVYYLLDNRLSSTNGLAAGTTVTDDFTVTVTDGIDSVSTPLSFTITGSNDAPFTRGASASLDEDGTVTASVMRSAADPDGDALTAVLQDGAAHGTVTLAANGTYTYTPDANFNGTDSFTYVVRDEHGAISQLARVQLNVAAVNDAPTLSASVPSAALVEAGNAGAGVATSTVSLQAADIDSTFSYVLAGWTPQADGSYTRAGTYGVATLDTAHNTVQYVLDNTRAATNALAFDAHVSDDFTITITDGSLSATVPVSFAVNGSNDAPSTPGSSASLDEDTTVTASVMDGAADPEGDALTAVLQDGAAHGTVTLAANGTYTYTPNANFNGTDSFTYVVRDTQGAVSQLAHVQLSVAAVNDAPTLGASAPSAVLVEAGSAGAGVATSVVTLQAADVDSTTSYVLAGWTHQADGSYTHAGTYGVATLDTVHNTVQYVLDNTRAATNALAFDAHVSDDFTITITDGSLNATVPVSFAVNGSNDAPSTPGSSASLDEDTTVTASVMGGAADPEGDALTAVLQDGAAHGTVTLAANGTYTYTPNANFNGTDSFTYVVRDTQGAVSQLAHVQLSVAAVNDAPTLGASAPSAVLVEAGSAGAGVATSVVTLQAADVDSTTSYVLAGWTHQADGSYTHAGTYGVATLDTVHNTVQYALDNTLAATNALAFDAHVSDNFTVTITDGSLSATVPVSFAINGSNDAPVGKADSATVLENASVSINVLGNDSDVDADALTINLTGTKSDLGATVTVVNGQVVYSADADNFDLMATGQSVTDHFSYTVSDGHGGVSAPIVVTVNVNEAHDNQVLVGTNKDDTFVDGPGHDTTYDGGNGDDTISGGDGADKLSGGNGNDYIDGGDGIDELNGDNGNDVLNGGNGNDKLNGGNGNDILFGGKGNDTLTGENGNDVFVFGANGGRDVITDFKAGEDKIVLGYSGNGSMADLTAFANASHTSSGLTFTNVDLNGDGVMNAVAITGGQLGDGIIVLANWTVAQLVGQHLITANNQVIGNWIG